MKTAPRSGFIIFGSIVLLSCLTWLVVARRSPAPINNGTPRAEPSAVATATPATAPIAATPAVPTAAPRVVIPPLTADANSVFGRFQTWSQQYLAAAPADRAALETEGLELARERRADFKSLIEKNPREALRIATPMVVRQQLPEAIVALLEERVARTGQLRVLVGEPLQGHELVVLRDVEFADLSTARVFVYGRREASTRWVPEASVIGVSVDNSIAVSEQPMRRLEVGEIIPDGVPLSATDPVSGKKIDGLVAGMAVREDQAVFETGTGIMALIDGGSTDALEELLIYAEGGTGGAQRFTGLLPGAPAPSQGQLRLLYLSVTFADQNQVPISETNAYENMRIVGESFARFSYGRLTVMTTVAPPVKLPHNAAWYLNKNSEIGGLGLEHAHAREEARLLGFDEQDYDVILVRINGGPQEQVSGWGGGNSIWVYGDGPFLVAHELGHVVGLGTHANFWNTGGSSVVGPGSNEEYGHSYDTMANSRLLDFNVAAKMQLNWLPNSFVRTVTESGTYRVHAFDQSQLDARNNYGLAIVKDSQRTYYAEVRATLDAESVFVKNGLILGWRSPSNGGGNMQQLDTMPSSPAGKADSPIIVGQTFSDYENDIHITTLAVNGSGPARNMDVQVNLGPFPGNRAPTLTLTTPSVFVARSNIGVESPVTITANAEDRDGDPLVYHWQWSDNTSDGSSRIEASGPKVTRSLFSDRQYVVTCTVSDMKGGRATRWLLLTVGNGGGKFAIQGRITLAGQPMPGVYVTASGSGSGNGITDTDGNYVISNLSAGNYIIRPLLAGYEFSEQFDNNILVGPGFTAANFAATALPAVAISAPTPLATEGGAAAVIRVTRSGPTGEDLTVKLNPPSGSAALTTDYTITPALTGGSAIIPAGESSLDLTITPVTDGATEGPETVIFQVVQDGAYLTTGLLEATATIADANTALPKVSVAAMAARATEAGATSGFIVSRTGSTSGALSVALTYGGTATSGTDYNALPATVSIPDGAASATFTLTPQDDSVAEGFETIVASLGTGSYVIDPLAKAATATLLDDDQATVSLAVTKAVGTEIDPSVSSDLDPAVMLVTRVGDLSGPLTVYYALYTPELAGVVTALHGVDFELLPGSITFGPGQATASLLIQPIYDGLGEPIETVRIQLSSGNGEYLLSTANSGTVTINDATDADGLQASYVEVRPTLAAREGSPVTAGTITFTLKGSVTSTANANVRFAVTGTATSGTDYTLSATGSITLAANGTQNVQVLTVTPVNDGVNEDLESITVTILPWDGTGAKYRAAGGWEAATIWLHDNRPTVFADAYNLNQNNKAAILAGNSANPAKFYVSRTGSISGALTVNFTLGGTAINGTDYGDVSGNALPLSIVIPANSVGAEFLVYRKLGYASFEGVKTIELSFNSSTAYSRSPAPAATLYFTDPTASVQRTVGFDATGSVVAESADAITLPVTLSSAAAGTVTVDYEVGFAGETTTTVATTPATAPRWLQLTRSGNVFTGSVSTDGTAWTPLGSAQTIVLGTTLYVGLAVADGDDDVRSSAQFEEVTLNGSAATGLVGRDVGFVSNLGEVSADAGVYTITGAGQNANVGLTGTGDKFYYVALPASGDFVFTAKLTASTGDNRRHAGIMVREDMHEAARLFALVLRGGSTLELLARRGSANTAQGGADYLFSSGTLTFAPGATTASLPLTIVDDRLPEPDERVSIILKNPAGVSLGGADHTVIIQDNDRIGFSLEPAVTVGFISTGAQVSEAEQPDVRVVLSAPQTGTVTVNYTVASSGTSPAVDGADYTLAPGTLTFAPGETVKTIPLVILDNDATGSPPRTMQVTLTDPVGATLNAANVFTTTIVDDDIIITAALWDTTAGELDNPGGNGSFILRRTGPTGPGTFTDINVSLSGTAINGVDYTNELGVNPIPNVFRITQYSSATLSIRPVIDAEFDPNETVVLTVLPGPGYKVGSPSSATLTISEVANKPVVSITPLVAQVSEAGGVVNAFLVSRTGSTSSSLAISLARIGSAVNATDYTTSTTGFTFTSGQSSRTITLTPTSDSLVEGDETVGFSIFGPSPAYDISPTQAAALITIIDDDEPPSVRISSPAAAAVQLALGTGLHLTAEGTNPGRATPLTYTWSKRSGPGTVTFGSPSAATTTAEFSAAGLYFLRVSAVDGGFTTSDEIQVQVGGLVAADWIDMGLGNPGTRGSSSWLEGALQLTGAGGGLINADGFPVQRHFDSTHFVNRQVSGTSSSIVACLTEFTAANAAGLAGVMIRETGYRGARRAALAIRPNGTLEWHTRSTMDQPETLAATVASQTLPLWLKLERNGDELTAWRAPDVGGAPGTWVQVGSALTLTGLANDVLAGMTATNSLNGTQAEAVFDGITLTPAPSGTALTAEPLGPNAAGTVSESGGQITVVATGAGKFGDHGFYRFQQYVGDVTVTTRVQSVSAGGVLERGRGGVLLRAASMDTAPFAAMVAYKSGNGSNFAWRNVNGGGTNDTNASGNAPVWLRIMRQGTTVSAWRAVDVAGNPGTWLQAGVTQYLGADVPVYVGVGADKGDLPTDVDNTAIFTNFTVVAGSAAPTVLAAVGGGPLSGDGDGLVLDATVTDDSLPNPPGVVSTQWSVVSGPGVVSFTDSTAVDTTAFFSQNGTYVLRLTADDGESRTYGDVTANIAGDIFVTSPTTASGTYGTAFTYNIVASGTPDTYNATGLPAGLSVNGSTGEITGSPTQTGTFTVALTASNLAGAGHATLTLTIAKATATVTLGSLSATYDDTPKSVSGTPSVGGLTVNVTYDGSATAPTLGGSYAVLAAIDDPNYTGSATGTLVIAKVPATVTLSGLTATYDTTAKIVTATTTPAGLPVKITYNNGNIALAAGSYAIVATINSVNYTGSATGTLTIAKANQTITFAGPANRGFSSTPFALAASASSGLAVTFVIDSGPATVSGSTLTMTGNGTVTVRARQTGGTTTYNAAPEVVRSFTIVDPITINSPTTAGGVLGEPFTYNITASGDPTSYGSTTLPAGLSLNTSFGAITGTPTQAGTFTVVVTATDGIASDQETLTLTIPKVDQTITFAGPGNQSFSATPIALSASVSSGLNPTFVVVSGPATVSGSMLTMTGYGDVTVKARQTGNTNYNAAPEVTRTFTVSNAAPTITWATPDPITYGTALSATQLDATASVAGSFEYDPAAGTVLAAGSHTLNTEFTPTDTGSYSSATSSVTLTVNKADQTITFATLDDMVYGDAPFALTASASSTLGVSYSITSGPATIAGDTVTITGAGTVTITAAQAGNANYNAATDVSRSFTVAKATPTVTWTTPDPVTYGTALSATQLNATASVAGSFAYTPASGAVPAVGDQTLNTTFTPADTANYETATDSVTLTVSKADQTITFAALGNKSYGAAAFTVSASASSGLDVAFSITSGPATIDGNTITLTGVGTVTVTAAQAGNANYNAATSVDRSFTVAKATAPVVLGNLSATYNGTAKSASATTTPAGLTVDITYNLSATAPTGAGSYAVVATINDANYEGTASGTLVIAKADQAINIAPLPNTIPLKDFVNPVPVSATATSGLTVTLTLGAGSVATLNGSNELVSIGSTGVVILRANQAGDSNYNPAPEVSDTFDVVKSNQMITFAPLANKTYGDAPFALSATADSSLTPTFSIVSGPATLSGSTLTITGAGEVTVRASQAGNGTYNPASDVNRTFTVARGSQTITFPTVSAPTYGAAPITLGATASSSLGVTYSIVSGPATVSGSTLTLTGAGSVVVRASQAGNADVLAAADVDQTITVAKKAITVTATSGQTKVFGAADPTFAYTVTTGTLVGSDAFTGALTRASGESAGTYAIGQGTLALNANYTLTFVGTNFTITPESATVTLGSLSVTYDGTAKNATATTTPAGLAVTFTYDGSATAPTAAGSYDVVGTINNANYEGTASGTLVIAPATATVSLSGLEQTYNGAPRPVTATTTPAGLTVVLTYDGGGTAPTDAGSYAVVATVDNANYEGTASGTLVIAKATATVSLTGLAQTYNGSERIVTATTTPGGLTVELTYNASATAPTNAGSYAVVATIDEANYEGSASGTLVVAPASATISLTGLAQTYNGTPRAVTVTTTPGGLTTNLVYYSDAIVSPANFTAYRSQVGQTLKVIVTGAASGSVIGSGPYGDTSSVGRAAVHAGLIAVGETKVLAVNILEGESSTTGSTANGVTSTSSGATAGSFAFAGLATGSATAPTNADLYAVMATLNETNYHAPTATGLLTISKAAATVMLGNLSATYDGTAKNASATTTPGGLTVELTYNGSATAPTVAGSYTVVGTIIDANAQGSASGTLVIAPASATISLTGLTQTYNGSARSVTATTTPGGLATNLVYHPDAIVAPADLTAYRSQVGEKIHVRVTGAASGSVIGSGPYGDTSSVGRAAVHAGLVAVGETQVIAIDILEGESSTTGSTANGVTSSSSGETDGSFAFAGLVSGSGTAPSEAGLYLVTATLNEINYTAPAVTQVFTVNKASATVTLGGLSATYDGTAKNATATTSPGGLTVAFTYNGSDTAPTDAGSYAVVGTLDETNYQGSASGTFVIGKVTAAVTWATPAAISYGTALSATQLNAAANVAGTFVYNPAAGTVLALGSHTLNTTFTPTDTTNYNGTTGAVTLSVTPQPGYDAWRYSRFTPLEYADDNLSGFRAIYYLDGVPNGVKYALGLEPNVPVVSGMPQLAASGAEWHFTYTRPTAVTDVTYAVQVSTDLTNWSATGVTHELVSTSGGMATWRGRFTPAGSATSGYFRLMVQGDGETTYSPPLGYMIYVVPAGQTRALSLPLLEQANGSGAFYGRLSAVGSNYIESTGAGWTAGGYSNASNPHYLRLRTGAAAGQVFRVDTGTANTGTRLYLMADGIDLTTLGLTVGATGDAYELVPADTLGSLLTGQVQGGASFSTADCVNVWGGAAYLTFYYNTTRSRWERDTDATQSRDDYVLRPERGFTIIRRAATELRLSVVGRVPDVATRVWHLRPGTTFLGSGVPVAQTLGNFSLQTRATGWQGGTYATAAAGADHIQVWGGASWLIFYYDTTNNRWQREGEAAQNNRNTYTIPAGQPIMIRRVGTGADPFITFPLPYTISR